MEIRYTEADLVEPALRVLENNPSGVTMEAIIKVLEQELEPKGKDAEINPIRGDTFFSQKVRNLKSHDTLTKKNLATYNKGVFKITEEGREYLKQFGDVSFAVQSQGLNEEERKTEFENNYKDLIIEEGAVILKNVKFRERSRKMTKVAKEFFKKENGKLFCSACGFDFEKKYDGLGDGYIEIHHTCPIHEHDTVGEKKSFEEVIKKVAPLCSNCHRMVHRNRDRLLSIDELKSILKQQELKN
jgi:predicted HNH restriction endonuclease